MRSGLIVVVLIGAAGCADVTNTYETRRQKLRETFRAKEQEWHERGEQLLASVERVRYRIVALDQQTDWYDLEHDVVGVLFDAVKQRTPWPGGSPPRLYDYTIEVHFTGGTVIWWSTGPPGTDCVIINGQLVIVSPEAHQRIREVVDSELLTATSCP